ncbi:MAG: transcriptional regulator [Bacteroidetes bacterium]|jgi:DNA-binding transcriptional regulator GbsR (MarR family)|nr:transcriptional regulator [Bacteroidota bacterium]
MNYEEAKEKFLQAWGTLGSSWGISRTMAQVHALLLISPESLCTEDIMKELQISRGNANMNLRDLIDWGLIFRELKAGERKEFFRAEKDIWKVAKQIIKERRKREIEPVLQIMEDLKTMEIEPNNKKHLALLETVNHIEGVVEKADFALEKAIKLDENALVGALFKLFK